ncbi:DUF3755 domain-containing protein [Cephalotus follicularis]|uniref:DUF3755 domain-containing protein n=1 Tax=Cephalotus follicularis TaxID=3775 RepID=A0A1Q3BZT7_CEPFO|nr:DUF3755 domain-containing protein [Cephalotus follicularis]
MANPSGNHQEANQAPTSSFDGPHPPHSGVETSGTALKHNPGLSADWSLEEQAILDDGLSQYASESNIICYAKIAMHLQNKTVRDVALRCRWMTKKENSKRRKEEHNITRKPKEKKERVTDPSARSSHLLARSNVPSYARTIVPMDYDDGISYRAIGGATGELLEQNSQAFNKISANLTALQTLENINLFCQARDNILKIMVDLNDMPEMMRQMPPLPVKVNEELANTILPPPSFAMLS